MEFIKNFPFFSIMICMFSAILSSILKSRAARYLTIIALGIIALLSAGLLAYLVGSGESYVYMMGHFPAPWGNELRAGPLEALMALFVSVIGLLSVIGGMEAVKFDIEKSKGNLFFLIVDLMMSSLLAMIYTNDLFTAYVFIEINTIAGCGLIMIRQIGKTTVTAMRYMIISLLGSGLFLIGVTLLYTLTGHLLMSDIKESVALLVENQEYGIIIAVIIGLITVGIAIKSGLYPFHIWIPEAYGYSNVSSSAMLSSIISKGYIFLLIKIYYRVIGIDIVVSSKVINIIFVFGVIGIIMGSVSAIREKSIRKIIAFSSVAQIGYIYLGIGLGTKAGIIAALFHILSHGATKSLLFISSSEFTEGSHTKKLDELTGLGKKYPISALVFTVGAFSMVGFPMLSGFISKLLFSDAAMESRNKLFIALFALAVSTILNAIYFLRIVVNLYSTHIVWHHGKLVEVDEEKAEKAAQMVRENAEISNKLVYKNRQKVLYFAAILALTAINFGLGMFSQPIIDIIEKGLGLFG